MTSQNKARYTRLNAQPIDLYFSFRPVSLIDTPHGRSAGAVPNCKGQVMVSIKVSGVAYGNYPTEIWTTTAHWEGRKSLRLSPESTQLKQSLADFHELLLDSWDCLVQAGFKATGDLIFKGRQRASGFIKTALGFRVGHLYWGVQFYYLIAPDTQQGYMVVTVREANAVTYGPYCTEIRTSRAQAAAFRPGLPPTPEQVTLKTACYALYDRIREVWPYFTLSPTADHAEAVERAVFSLGLTPILHPSVATPAHVKTPTP